MAVQEVQWHAIDNMDFDASLTKVPIIQNMAGTLVFE